jgi:isopentenyl-diphosphate delta-isomerase
MGFDCPLEEIFSFTYHARFENGLTEHEFDHVFVGTYDGDVTPDRSEVQAHRYLSLDRIRALLEEEPASFTHWFHLAFPKIAGFLERAHHDKQAG